MEPSAQAEGLVRVLGGVEARASPAEPWARMAPQQRLLLALLTSRVGRPCRLDWLVEALWGETAPANPTRSVQALVSRLRGVVDPPEASVSRLRTVPGGWCLDLESNTVDVARFEELVAEAETLAGRSEAPGARARLAAALGLWRGRPFGEWGDHPWLADETARLEERCLATRERLLRLRLQAGECDVVAAEARQLVAAHPLRERLWGVLMEAQCAAGQPAAALMTYQQLRERLGEELGAEPSAQLQALHAAVLRGEASGPATAAGAAPAAAAAGQAGGGAVGGRVPGGWPCRRGLPLAGRGEELAALRRTLEEARLGSAQLALVGGEPGIGKTRLVAEFADGAAACGVDVLVGRCVDGPGVSYQPFVDALAADVAATPDASLAARLGDDAGELSRLLPALALRTGRQPAPASVSPELDQHRLFNAVAGWLTAAAAQGPLMVVLEDLHAATRPTWLLLAHVARTVWTARLLVVATYRDTGDQLPDELADMLGELTRSPNATRLALGGLDRAAVGELVGADAALPVPADWADAIHSVTAGHPLFVEELLAALPRDRPAGPQRLAAHLGIPRGVDELVAARLRRLGPATTEWLDQAAVAGEHFDFTEATHAAGLTEDQALDAAGEATGARLIIPAGADEAYAFTHALTRDALLARLTPSRRMRLHARLAVTVEARHADDPTRVASRLVHYYAAAGAAGDAAKTRRYALAAGDAAMAQRAYDDAAAFYQDAAHLTDASDDEERCEMLTRLARAQAHAGHPDRDATLHQAADLALGLADPQRIVDAALAGSRGFGSQVGGVDQKRVGMLRRAVATVPACHPGPRAVLLALLASELIYRADLAERRQLTDEALTLARHHGDPLALAQILALRQLPILHPATLADRLPETKELIDRADQLDDPVVRVLAQTFHYCTVLEIGDRRQADSAADEAVRLAEDLGHPAIQAFITMLGSGRELLWGDLDHADQISKRYRTLAHSAHTDDIESGYLAQQFVLHRERGRLSAFLPLLDQALESYGTLAAWHAAAATAWWLTGHHDRALQTLDRYAADAFAGVPHDHLWTVALCLFADCVCLADRHDAARALLDRLAPYHDRLAVEPAAPHGAVAHYLGLLATTIEEWDQAAAYLDQAAATHHRLRAARWHNRTRLAQARLLTRRNAPGDGAQAERLLHTVHAKARALGQPGLIEESRQLLTAGPLSASVDVRLTRQGRPRQKRLRSGIGPRQSPSRAARDRDRGRAGP